MSTRSVLAVERDGDWKGVYHRFDSVPWRLGNALIAEVRNRNGDFAPLIAEAIDEAPGGWSWFPDRQRADGPDTGFFNKDGLNGQAWIEWVYLFKPEARQLVIYAGNPAFGPEPDPEPYLTIQFTDDSRTDPPVSITPPPPPWPKLPVARGWDDHHDDEALRQARSRLQAHARRLAESKGTTVGALRQVCELLLAQAILRAEWVREPGTTEAEFVSGFMEVLEGRREAPSAPVTLSPTSPWNDADNPLYTRFVVGSGDHYWALRLGPIQLLYPTAAALRQDIDPIVLFRKDGLTSRLDDLAERLKAASADGLHPSLAGMMPSDFPLSPAEVVDYIELLIARALNPDTVVLRDDDGDVYSAREIVEKVEHPDKQVLLSRVKADDAEAEAGQFVFVSYSVPMQWLLLDWIRVGQTPDGIDPVDLGPPADDDEASEPSRQSARPWWLSRSLRYMLFSPPRAESASSWPTSIHSRSRHAPGT